MKIRLPIVTEMFHELPPFSQPLLGGNLVHYSPCKNRTDAIQKNYRNKLSIHLVK